MWILMVGFLWNKWKLIPISKWQDMNLARIGEQSVSITKIRAGNRIPDAKYRNRKCSSVRVVICVGTQKSPVPGSFVWIQQWEKRKIIKKKSGKHKTGFNFSLFREHKKENKIGKDSIWNSLIRKIRESPLHMKCKRKHLV